MAVRLAAIGTGGLGQIELAQYAEMDDVDIVAAADVAESARTEFVAEYDAPAYESFEQMLDEHGDELDAANIVTPHTLHYRQVKACLEHDLHVFVEKPFVTDIENGVELVRAAKERDLVLQIGYQRHFHPAFVEIKRLIDDGRIGDLHMVNAYLGQNWIDPFVGKWRTNPDLSGGGQLYDSGSHLLDSLLWTTGTEPVSVAAAMDFREHDVDVNSAISALLERQATGETVTASIGISGDGVFGPPEEALVIWGTEGKISYTQDHGEKIRVVEKDGRSYTSEITDDLTQTPLTEKKLANFVGAIQDENEPEVPGEYGLQVTALTEAAYEAFERGETIDVRAKLAGIEAGNTVPPS